jgi:excisionase family DNA binding protein
MNDYLTPAEYAKLHGVSRTLVYKWIDQERIPVRWLLGRLAIAKKTPRPEEKKAGRPKKE